MIIVNIVPADKIIKGGGVGENEKKKTRQPPNFGEQGIQK